jgi:hypothetical protein
MVSKAPPWNVSLASLVCFQIQLWFTKKVKRLEYGIKRNESVEQLRGGVNQLLPILNTYAYFQTHYKTLNDDYNSEGK